MDMPRGKQGKAFLQFDFGRNWFDFSQKALDAKRVEQAITHFDLLMDGIPLENKFFLDIGFGQGLSLLSAASRKAHVVGNDINPTCAKAFSLSANFFPTVDTASLPLVFGSILDPQTVRKLCDHSPKGNGFDVVHSWGVLHHTGNMHTAFVNAASLVKPGGHFVIALYNRHVTSPLWTIIKHAYCRAPKLGRAVMIAGFYPLIWTAKLIVTKKNPWRKERGMSFYHDVIDWIGGFPYEYASIKDVIDFATALGFQPIKWIPASTPIGCNEFVFKKK